MLGDLLPGNATGWERVLADAMDTSGGLSPSIMAIRGTKLVAPPPSFLPFLIYEYGLGELTPFVPNLYELIAEGIDWQRVRGTPAAMALALSWLGYAASIEEESTQRRYWNMFQLQLDRVRDEESDLDRIAGVARLSVPIRSRFWRGFRGLDVRPLTFSKSHFGDSHYGEYSGKRLQPGGPLWSFGRQYEFDVTVSDADLVAMGVFVEALDSSVESFGLDGPWFEQPNAVFEDEIDSGQELGWGNFSWNDTEATWVSSSLRARSEAMASATINRRLWFAFRDHDGALIGYRRARALQTVVSALTGPFSVAGNAFRPKSGPDVTVYAECQTGFGEGAGRVAASVGLVFDAQPTDSARPGQAWLEPDEITGGTAEVALSSINIAFGETIRERVKILLRF